MGKRLGWALALSAVSCFVNETRAADLEVQTLKPTSPSDAQLLGTHSAKQAEKRSLSLGLSLSYLNDPLVLVDAKGHRVASLVGVGGCG